MKYLTPSTLLLGALVGLGGAALTITPTSHDFGKVGLTQASQAATVAPKQLFKVVLPTNTPRGTTLRVVLVGRDAREFSTPVAAIPLGDCALTQQAYECAVAVTFKPFSLGKKTAILGIADGSNALDAVLAGEAVDVKCEMRVVSCNYAHLYTGTFIWTSGTQSPGASSREHVQVNVVAGEASCNGSVIDSGNGRTRTGRITGTGLIGIEFVISEQKPVYRITVACPTPDWPATADEPATPSQPAELGHNEQSSYDQPATDGVGMNLIGRYDTPHSDPLNGVTGNLWVSWELCMSGNSRVVQVAVVNPLTSQPAGEKRRVCV